MKFAIEHNINAMMGSHTANFAIPATARDAARSRGRHKHRQILDIVQGQVLME